MNKKMFFAILLGGLCAVSFTPLALAMNDGDNLDLSSINKNNINDALPGYAGMTLLHLAAADADENSIKQCLKLGANAVRADNSSNSPLNLILQSKKCTLNLVKLLVDALVLKAQKDQINDLSRGAYFGTLNYEELTINRQNSLSMTPLDLAITFQTENPEVEQIVEYLLINGAHLNIGKSKPNGLFTVTSPLFQASRRGLHNIVRLLLEYAGREITKKIINEYYGSLTPLHAAINSGNVETVKVLLKFGADPEMKTKDAKKGADHFYQTPELLAETNAKIYKDKANNYTEIVELLRDKVRIINGKDKKTSEEENDDAVLNEESDEDDDTDAIIPNSGPDNGISHNATQEATIAPPVAPIALAPQPRLLDLMGWQGRATMRLAGALNEVLCEPLALDETILFALPAILSYHRINKFRAIDYIAGILPLCAYGLKAYRGAREPNLCNKPYKFQDALTQCGILAADGIYLSQIKNRKQQGIYAPSNLFQKLIATSFLINLGRVVLTIPIRAAQAPL